MSRRPTSFACPVVMAAFCLRAFLGALGLLVAMAGLTDICRGASVRDAEEMFRQGKYSQCASLAADQIERGVHLEAWRHYKARAELAQGEYAAALDTIDEGIDSYPSSIQMRMLAHEVYQRNDQSATAAAQLAALERFARRNPRRYTSPPDRLVLGKYFLRRGADSRQVLELFFDPLTKRVPDFVDAHLASAELALEKYDNALAAELLASAPESAQQDPRYHFLLARAYAEDEPNRAAEALQAALDINPRHAESLLLQAERLIDSEKYDEARSLLEKVRDTNPRHPLAWAYEAVVAHLLGDKQQERAARNEALAVWSTNPAVDHTIGRKLSDKYRFSEGAEYQQRSLEMDTEYSPARMQLAQDLLRLGKEQEGWPLIQEVYNEDGYNVVARNLVMLHDSFDEYRLLVNDSFRVRMNAREAQIYGHRVLELLDKAQQELCAKYDVEFDQPVLVEIFPQQSDFAVRTFGIPGADGFLGVCFGNVITANSPAALGSNFANWEAVLWHELCHAVTLRKSRNRMPRWLSEGISVYEELQQDPSWGQRMTPGYREMILAGEFAPLSELSSAFLFPRSPQHLQFAYFESALAVQHLADNYGMESIKQLLNDLAGGSSMNEALIRRVAPLGKLDAEFDQYLRDQAAGLAPGLNWAEMDLPPDASPAQISSWLDDHPDNFAGLVSLAEAHLQQENWQKALPPAERLRELYPTYVGTGNAYSLLARAHSELGNVAAEREALAAWAERDSAAVDAYLRLMELGEMREDWSAVARNAARLLAVNPLTPVPHRYLAQAARQLDRPHDAILAYEALLHFDTSNPVDAHFRLAKLHHRQGDTPAARRHVLMALEDAPRFLEAHDLLLQLVDESEASSEEVAEQATSAPPPAEPRENRPPPPATADPTDSE